MILQNLDPQQTSIELLKFGLNLTLLFITWTIGHRLLLFWEDKKRVREISRDMRKELHNVFGQFKSNTRRWKNLPRADSEESHSELVDDLAEAEGFVDSLLSDISALKVLTREELVALGLFRQAYQTLRQAIDPTKKRPRDVPAQHRDAHYHLFSALTVTISRLFVEGREEPSAEEARRNLRIIMNVRTKDWQHAMKVSEELKINDNYDALVTVLSKVSEKIT